LSSGFQTLGLTPGGNAEPMHPETLGSVCDDMGLREAAPRKGSGLAAGVRQPFQNNRISRAAPTSSAAAASAAVRGEIQVNSKATDAPECRKGET